MKKIRTSFPRTRTYTQYFFLIFENFLIFIFPGGLRPPGTPLRNQKYLPEWGKPVNYSQAAESQPTVLFLNDFFTKYFLKILKIF